MSDEALSLIEKLSLEDTIARIERQQAEVGKLIAEQSKLTAESSKLDAEAA